MKRYGLTMLSLGLCTVGLLAQNPTSTKEAIKPQLVMQDQFDRKQDLADFKGDVVVLLFGDKSGMSDNRELGSRLHIQFHPSAKGASAEKAATAPVIPLADLPKNQRSPDVKVIPVACIGKVPEAVQSVLRWKIKQEAPHTSVWLDFEEKMQQAFGMQSGEPNLVVIDTTGNLRMKAIGKLDEKSYARLVEKIDQYRKEAIRGK